MYGYNRENQGKILICHPIQINNGKEIVIFTSKLII